MYTVIENAEEIDRFLNGFVHAGAPPLLPPYLSVALRKPLEKQAAFFTDTGKNTRVFHPEKVDEASIDTIRQVCVWITDALTSKRPWVERLDNEGRPDRLQQISTLEDAQNRVDKDAERNLKEQFSEAGMMLGRKQRQGHIKIIRKLPDGNFWIQLLTGSALREEGNLMHHCLGNGTYDPFIRREGTAIYSLRNSNGFPQVTMQVENGVLLQCRDGENAPPLAENMDAVRAFIQEKHLAMGKDFTLVCIVNQDGEYHSLREIPKGFRFNGSYVLKNSEWLKEFPADLSVAGEMLIKDCKNFERIDKSVKGEKSIKIDNCAKLQTLTGNLSAKNSLTISNNHELESISGKLCAGMNLEINSCYGLLYMAGNLAAGRDIEIHCCSALLDIGNKIYAGNTMKIGACTQLKSIGKDITVGRDLHITNCQLFSTVGENLHVEGNLIIAHCPNIKPLPLSTHVGKIIYWDGKTFESVAAFNDALENASSRQPAYPRPAPFV